MISVSRAEGGQGESLPHQALVELQCSEMQQLALYVASKSISICNTCPVITFSRQCSFGGARFVRFCDDQDHPEFMQGIAGRGEDSSSRRLSHSGILAFQNEILADVLPVGESDFGRLRRQSQTPVSNSTQAAQHTGGSHTARLTEQGPEGKVTESSNRFPPPPGPSTELEKAQAIRVAP